MQRDDMNLDLVRRQSFEPVVNKANTEKHIAERMRERFFDDILYCRLFCYVNY